jgi:hypothetical protein
MFGVAFVLFRNASSPLDQPPTWHIALDTALDLAILSIGATGAMFDNPTVEKALGENLVSIELSVIGVSFLSSSLILVIKRFLFWLPPERFRFLLSVVTIDLGALTLFITSGVLAYSYHSSEFGFLRWAEILGIALGCSTLAGAILTLLVSLMVASTPDSDKIAHNPMIAEGVRRSLRDFTAGESISIADMPAFIQQERK